MASTPPSARFKTLTGALNRASLWLCLAFLPGMAALTVLDVACRWAFSSPIPGSRELNELALLMLVSLGLGHAHEQKANVHIALFLDRLPAQARAFCQMATGFLGLLIAGIISASFFLSGLEDFDAKTATDMLGTPLFPFRFAASAGFFLLFATLAADVRAAGRAFFKTSERSAAWTP
ncbi:putative TRAP-type mannitol/chloroaromatic compound transport system, small permease component [Candidatus Desulfarcum epimagneticum]|uniref:Putative TRAP-type mannitol/chloroaromatic compound transport system, small permease component n=1 Tax=uncultured Desulfobacteraceae bacterium TaxID=218296 RepID=A0A484HMR8_9BACT|nr:putative TRAP-type mannitol/chloroaromatic compound transport system, small permease component [uncultured Desulfobacteraceae bacterium]